MRLVRYHQLVGMKVVAADGQTLGRVADLTAERRGDDLVVTALLIGPHAFIQRVGFRWLARFDGRAPRRAPWSFVASIDDRVHLREPAQALATLPEFGPDAPPEASA